jgi:hypothetical protein
MLPCRVLIASFSVIAKRRFDSRSLQRLPLTMTTTHGATTVRRMLTRECSAVGTAAIREVPAKMAALGAVSLARVSQTQSRKLGIRTD